MFKKFQVIITVSFFVVDPEPAVFVYKYIDANARAGNEFRSYGKAVSGRVIKKVLKNSFTPKVISNSVVYFF